MLIKPKDPTPQVRVIYKFRYACHGCSNVAGHGAEPFPFGVMICPHCKHENVYRPGNWLPMTDEEIKKMNV